MRYNKIFRKDIGKISINNKNHTRGFVLLKVLFLLTFFSILILPLISAVGEPSFCAERTKSGAWCQNVPQDQIDTRYGQAPTSCDSTPFCRLGTCVNSQEGTCLENTPQRVCQDNSGVWVEGKPEEIPQCKLGCCLLGDQAAFVTQTRCKSLAGTYGIESNFRTDINTEAECIASANPDVKGACVLDQGFNNRNCRLLTRAECQQLESSSSGNTTIEFHEGLLCSAESLATNCGKSTRTTCLADKDEVYFLDTCGNLANIYDASKIDNQEYWTNIKTKAESCNPSSSNGNAGSASCGNCDYLSGSTCKAYQRGNTQTPTQPTKGDFVCADLSCRYTDPITKKVQTYKHGETWCANSLGINKTLPGSEYARLVCYSGEVTTEPCSSFREEICVQDSIQTDQGDFKTAACKLNQWQDCTFQDNKADCENVDDRDCKWLVGESILRDNETGNPLVVNSQGELVQGSGSNGAACVPKYAPGFDFWNPDGDAESICLQASQECVVRFKKGLTTGFSWECDQNCDCIGLKKGDKPAGGINKVSAWVNERNTMCMSLGDCGNKTNYIGAKGYQSTNAVEITKDIG